MAWICRTPLSWSWTAEVSPPNSAWPQVTIALSPWQYKAKAHCVAATCGWSARAVRHSPSSISASSKVLSGSTSTRFLAVKSLRHFFPKACWAFVFRSCTVEEGRSVRSSACPFGKATFIRIISDVLKILTTLQNISNESLLDTLSPNSGAGLLVECLPVDKCFKLIMDHRNLTHNLFPSQNVRWTHQCNSAPICCPHRSC